MKSNPCERCEGTAIKQIETKSFGAEALCEGCERAVVADGQTVRRRFTLSDFAASNKNLAAWLAYDGNPPTVEVTTTATRNRYGYFGASDHAEVRVVNNEETASIWWNSYRNALGRDWSKSALNTCKPQTHKQFLDECLRSIGIKRGGTIEERIQRAIGANPTVYVDAETVNANEKKEIEEWNLSHGRDRNGKPLATGSAAPAADLIPTIADALLRRATGGGIATVLAPGTAAHAERQRC